MASTHEKDKSNSSFIALNNFLHKNRIFIFILLGLILLFTLGFIIFNETNSKRIEKSALLSEELEELYSNWQQKGEEDTSRTETEEMIFALSENIFDKYPKHFASQRALMILGDLFFEKKEWNSASEKYLKLADTFKETHLTPVALMNAASAFEEVGDFNSAADLYRRITNISSDFHPDIPRAIFSLGRVLEGLGNKEEALSAYNLCIDRYPSSNWTKLSRNRIIYLNSR